ncbi:hypothetical protein CR195_027730 (plasmid) [Bacillus cereus]|nr:hypothetical protein CR195_027730 [Bacillus cereus]
MLDSFPYNHNIDKIEPALFSETYRKRKKGHTSGICMRRCVLLQDRFRSILILSSYHKSY